jgi:hypothetical protein
VSTPEQQRKVQASKDASTRLPGRPRTQPCGTLAAYRWHTRDNAKRKKNGLPPLPIDAACKAKWAAYLRDWRARKMLERSNQG